MRADTASLTNTRGSNEPVARRAGGCSRAGGELRLVLGATASFPSSCKQAGLGTPGIQGSAGECARAVTSPGPDSARKPTRLCASRKRVGNNWRRHACAHPKTARAWDPHVCPPCPRCLWKSKGLDVARTCPLQSREPPARRFSPVGTMVTDTLSHALHSSWGKYPDRHGMSLITARFQLAQEAIWARAPVPELMAAQLSHVAGLRGSWP